MPPQVPPRTTSLEAPTPTITNDSPESAPTPDLVGPPDADSRRAAVSTFLSLLSEMDSYSTSKGTERPPASLLSAYESAYSALPHKYGYPEVLRLTDYHTNRASKITRTPFASTIQEPEPNMHWWADGQFGPEYGCGPGEKPGEFRAIVTVPASVTEDPNISTFLVPFSVSSCLQGYLTSDRFLTIGAEAFTSYNQQMLSDSPCPAYYTMDVVYPHGEDPRPYTTVQWEDIIHDGRLNGICCPMATDTTDTWRFSDTICARTDATSTTLAFPIYFQWYAGWALHSTAIATSTVTDGIPYVSSKMFITTYDTSYFPESLGKWFTSGVTIPSFTTAPTTTTTSNGNEKLKDPASMPGVIVGAGVGILLFCAFCAWVLNKRNKHYPIMRSNATDRLPTNRPGATSQQPTPGLIPRTTAEVEADPPPTYSADVQEGEIPLSRLDPNGTTMANSGADSGPGVGVGGAGAGAGGNSYGHISWNHLEIPSPSYAPSSRGGSVSPGRSVSIGSDHGLLQDIPAEPAPAYTVLRD